MRPDREKALRMWAEKLPNGRPRHSRWEIAEACGYADDQAVSRAVRRFRKSGDPNATRRAPGHKRPARTQAVVIRLFGKEGTADIADRLGISVNAVNAHISKARKRGLLPPATRGKAA